MNLSTKIQQDVVIVFDPVTTTVPTPTVPLPVLVNLHTLNYTIKGSPASVSINLIGQTGAGYQTSIASVSGVTANGTMSGIGIFSAIFVDIQITGSGSVQCTYAGRMFSS